MSKSSSSSSSGGVGFVGLLQIAFIVLKLMGYIEWDWVWVLSPTWISILLVLVIILGFGIFAIVMYALGKRAEKRAFTTRYRRRL